MHEEDLQDVGSDQASVLAKLISVIHEFERGLRDALEDKVQRGISACKSGATMVQMAIDEHDRHVVAKLGEVGDKFAHAAQEAVNERFAATTAASAAVAAAAVAAPRRQ